MAERKPIGKKKRFEVFKRDKFTCQYCGRTAPSVILEVDHLKPVAEGGNNGMMNLITSCRECNRGKGKTLLTDNVEVRKQQKQILELAEKREQMEMLIQWRDELNEYENLQAEELNKRIKQLSDWECSDHGKNELKKLIRRFSFVEVMDAIDISYTMYYEDGDRRSWNKSFDKIGGVCYNRRKQGQVKGYETN